MLLIASMARSEGPKGFSLESSLISRERRSKAAGAVSGAFVVPMSRAGVETRSKNRLMLAASCHGRLCARYRFIAGGAQAINFLLGQGTELSGRNVERKRPVADALDLFHMVSDFLEHPPDFSIAPLDQRDLVPRIVGFLNQPDARRRSSHPPSIFRSDRNSSAQFIQRILARSSCNLHHVSFGHLRCRLHQLIRERTIIG